MLKLPPLSVAIAATMCVASVGLSEGLEFASAVRSALDGPDVRVARLQLQDAEAAARVAGQVVTGTARVGVQGSRSSFGSDEAWEASLEPLTVQMALLVVPFGPAFEAAERARGAVVEARRAVLEAALTASVVAAERWWAAERAERALDAASEYVAIVARERDAVALQVAAGTAGEAALSEVDIALLTARIDMAAAEVDRDAALVGLAQVVGEPVSGVAPRAGDSVTEAEAWLAAFRLPAEAVLDAAASGSAQVITAERALEAAIAGAAQARRDVGPSASLSTALALSGETASVSVAGGIDTRAYQPNVELQIDPFARGSAGAGASVAVTVSATLPLGSAQSAFIERADLAVELAAKSLEAARVQARLEIDAAARALDAAEGQVRLALERLALRTLQRDAAEVRAGVGAMAPLELERSHRDLADAARALDAALDGARVAQARLAIVAGESPFSALGLDLAIVAELTALVEGIAQEVP